MTKLGGAAWGRLGRWLVGAALAVVAAACGGGGGSGGDSGTGLRVQNVSATGTTQQVFAALQGLRTVTITADVVGDLSRLNGQTIYVIVEDPARLFQTPPRVYVMADGKGNRIELDGAPLNGREGSYRQPLRVSVCLDAGCSRQLDGSPFQVPMQVDVLPGVSFPGAAPRVIDLAFGATGEVTVPVSLPAGTTAWWPTLSPVAGAGSVPYTLERLPTEAPQLRLSIPRLPPGRYESTIQVNADASLDGQDYTLSSILSVVVNVQAAPEGVVGAWSPESVVLEAFASGSGSEQGMAYAYLLSADGTRYTDISRIVYLPAGPEGNQDAGGIEWMLVGVGVDSSSPETLFVPQTSGCVQPPTGGPQQCLSPGRYDALLYVRTFGGVELPLPLRVSVNVLPG